MELPIHDFISLFEQLGLDASEAAIDTFIAAHRPIPGDVELSKADFWNPAQADFLKQVKDDDADWAEIVDQLDARLR